MKYYINGSWVTLDSANADTLGSSKLSPGNASGNIPVSNGTKNINLNADKLDGYDADTGTTASTIPVRDSSGKIPGSITGDAATIGGNAPSAFATSGHTHSVVTTTADGLMGKDDKIKLNGIAAGAEVNQNAFSNIAVSGQTTIAADAETDTLTLAAGTNISITTDATNDKITIGVTGITSGAEINQNAFSNVKVGTTTISADTKTDTLELTAGTAITLTPDATNDKVTVAVDSSQFAASSHVGSTGTAHGVATQSAAGFISTSDKTKLDNIAIGANNYTHPASHPASMITEDATHNFVTTIEKSTWNSSISDIDATSVTLSHGLNNVTVSSNGVDTVPFNVLNIKGRTLVNLLGRDGNCEDVSKFNTYQTTLALDSSNKTVGSNSVKVTVSAGTAGSFWSKQNITVGANKYYIILADVKIGGSASYSSISMGGTHVSTSKALKSDATDSAIFTTLYRAYAVTTGSADAGITISVTGAVGSFAYVDAERMYEISQAEYNALGTTLTDINKIAEKYPYVEDMKSLTNPYVNVYGQNLLPDFSKWTLHANAKVTESYRLALDTTANNQTSSIDISCLPSTTYTISFSIMNGKHAINFFDASGVYISSPYGWGVGSQNTFTTPSNATIMRIMLSNDTLPNATYTWFQPMLNLGSTALPFVPRNDSPICFQTSLASSLDGSVYDSINYQDGSFVKTARFKEMVLDGSLVPVFTIDHTGFKQIQLPISYNIASATSAGKANLIKYDGKNLIEWVGNKTGYDQFEMGNNGYVYITIQDTDSGWGETYTPTVDEINAYFYGWRMCNTDGTPYTSGVKGWNKLYVGIGGKADLGGGVVEGGTYTNTLPTTYAYDDSKCYRLQYQLATPTQEVVQTEGLMPVLQAGQNQVELGEGVVVRENVIPDGGTADTGYTYVINYKWNVYNSWLKNPVSRFIEIYKNGIPDKTWKITISTNGYGGLVASCSQNNYDPTASYSVTYIAQPYQLSASVQSLDASYETNLRTVVDNNTQRISDLSEKITKMEVVGKDQILTDRNTSKNYRIVVIDAKLYLEEV
jgi:hypothetical protein